MEKINKKMMFIGLVLTIICIIWGIIFKLNVYKWITANNHYYQEVGTGIESLGLIPFKSFMHLEKSFGIWHTVYTSILNVALFFPFAGYLSFLLKDKNKGLYVTLLTFAFSLILEIIQYFTRLGVFDVTDIILNTLGGFIGYLLYRFGYSRLKPKVINIINCFFLVIGCCAAIYGIINTIIHFNYYI